ncbi:pheromone autoinducer 2 transporter [Leptotrichia shahii]|uniref:Pheromone autoinducer 2 transporter n=1 Tax=Leptotrichia shahii TaxID=157691 RepID=A0A510JNS0_9FUSO|nr:AI-2E family transporter [Leptotrichia shahii]BBM39995.1 pheromone autoinducer 2 transporter [Leptotrichia shahii]
MKFYDEEKLLKLRNILIVTVLALLALLLFFRVYDNFAKPIRLVTSTIFPFILSFIIVYCLMPFIDMISEKDKNDSFLKNSKLDELEKVEKMNISDSEKRKKIELFNEISQSNKKKRIKLNRTFAILLVLTVFFIIFLYIVLTIVPIFTKQVSSLIDFLLKNQGKLQNNFFEFLERNNIDLKSSLISSKDIIVSNVIKVLSSSFSLISSTFSLLFMTPIFTIMLIFSYDNIENGVKRVLRNMDREDLIILIKNMDETIGKYILVTALDSMIVGVVSFIIFYFLKMDYSMLFSVIIGFGNVIPFIGPFIGLIPAILYAFTKSFKLVIFIVVLITIVQTIEANIVKPWLTGKSVEMHPITTLLVVLIGGALFGIGGAFIAIPVYIIVKLTFLFFWEKYTVNNKLNEKRK